MASDRNIVVFDTETTGLSYEAGCEIIQLSAKAINGWDLSDHHAGELNLLIKPKRPEKAQAGALRVVGPLFERAKNEGLEPQVAYKRFIEYMNLVNDGGKVFTSPIMVAYNIRYDMSMLKPTLREYKLAKANENGDIEYPWYNEFEAMCFAFSLFESAYDVNNFKLDTWLNKLGLTRKSETHDAMEDVKLLTEAFRRSMKFYRTCYSKMKIVNSLPKI